MPPRLSVVIPFHDEPAFVDAAVASVLSQPADGIDAIVVNDNPETYGPGFFDARPWAGRVQVIHHPRNLGLSAARNSGIAASGAALVGFLDSDDYFTADGLARQLARAEATGADITHGCALTASADRPWPVPLPRDARMFRRPDLRAGLTGMEEAQFFVSSWSSLYRRDFLDRQGLRFDPEQTRFEDRLFVLETVLAADRIATLGEPVRVWRRRAGSISVSPPDAATHRLQLQLLEKCMAAVRRATAAQDLPPRFLKRELFNTLSRLIWDVTLVAAAARGGADHAGWDARIAALFGEDRLGSAIFDDPVLRPVSRVGSASRLGRVTRAEVFALQSALAAGDLAAAARRLEALGAAAAAPPAPRGARRRLPVRLVLHLGLPKTGSTAIQARLAALRPALARRGVILPVNGWGPAGWEPTRPGGFPGHQGLLAAARTGDASTAAALRREVAAAGCGTALISCENMALLLDPDAAATRARLFDLFDLFDGIDCVAFVRRCDDWAESLYRETVCNGHAAGALGPEAFLVETRDRLTDLPALLGGFESATGRPVRLADYDAAIAGDALWPAFVALAGLPGDLAAPAGPAMGRVYPTPDRDAVRAARLSNALIHDGETRRAVLRAFFRDLPAAGGGADAPLLSPGDRRDLLARFRAVSGEWAAARGHAPDHDALIAGVADDWSAPGAVGEAALARLERARQRVDAARAAGGSGGGAAGQGPAAANRPAADGPAARAPALRLRPRPWVLRALAPVRRLFG
jgi:hypothetical protein